MPPSNQPLAKVSEVGAGRTLRVDASGEAVLLCNVGGKLYAIEDVCTHDGGEFGSTELEGSEIVCPRHGACFDVITGAALTLPAILPVRTFPLRIEGDDVFLA